MVCIGHIGTGRMARGRAAQFLKQKDVRLVIGWSRGEASRAEYAKLTGARVTDDWRGVVEEPSVHAVCVGTPTSTHVEYAVAALEAGKHVLVECPVAGEMAEFDRMVEAAERNGVVFYPASNYRFDETAQAFKHAVGRVGQVLLARGDFSWRPRTAWYFDRALSGGVFPCVHLYLATVFHCLGRAIWVDAALSPDGEHGTAMVRYESGASSVMTGGFQHVSMNECALVGAAGVLRRQPEDAWAILRPDSSEPVSTEALDTTGLDNAAFLRCVRGEEDWRPHAERERAIHAVAVGAQLSAERGERVSL